MNAGKPLSRLTGSRTIPVTWAELDSDYALKLPTLFHPCLDVLTDAITGFCDFFGMGRRGIAPITHYLEIAAGSEPLALGRTLELRYTIALCWAELPASGGGPSRRRLLLDQRIALRGFRRSGSATELGYDDGSGASLAAGDFRLVQVFTRPFAPPEARQVDEVPAEFAGLQAGEPEGPAPSLAGVWAEEAGWRELPPSGALPMGHVWGRGHTDVNHHVTVTEYLRLLETAFVARLDAAGLPLPGQRTARVRCLFRRPFFAGERCAVDGRLWRDAHGGTRLLGGVYACEGDGKLAAQPSVGARLDGLTSVED